MPSWPRVGGGWALAAVLAAVAVALAGFAVLAYFRPGASPGNTAYVDGATTGQVKAAAKEALTTVYGYDAATIDGWPAKVHTVLTGDMARDFDKTAQTTINAVKQSDTKTDVRIDPIGVTVLDGDQAEVLADVNVSASRNNVATGSVAGPIILRMTKVNGRWLASHVASTYLVGQ
jgi:Mce-associated membrane protein